MLKFALGREDLRPPVVEAPTTNAVAARSNCSTPARCKAATIIIMPLSSSSTAAKPMTIF